MKANSWSLHIAVVIAVVVCNASTFATAQASDAKSLLSEASYIFNRFSESATEISASIELHYPDQIKSDSKQALDVTQSTILDPTFHLLNSQLGKTHVSSEDLLTIYMGLVSISGELSDSSQGVSDFGGDERFSMELVKLRVRTNLVAMKIYLALKNQMVEQTSRLSACSEQKAIRNQGK